MQMMLLWVLPAGLSVFCPPLPDVNVTRTSGGWHRMWVMYGHSDWSAADMEPSDWLTPDDVWSQYHPGDTDKWRTLGPGYRRLSQDWGASNVGYFSRKYRIAQIHVERTLRMCEILAVIIFNMDFIHRGCQLVWFPELQSRLYPALRQISAKIQVA